MPAVNTTCMIDQVHIFTVVLQQFKTFITLYTPGLQCTQMKFWLSKMSDLRMAIIMK